MSNPAPTSPAKIIVVGLGHHGALLAHQIVTRGYQLVGAVEVNHLAGTALGEIVPGATSNALVHPTPQAAVTATHPDLAILAASVPTTVAVDLIRQFLAEGINVLALPTEIFDTDQDWRAELDEIGRQTGATFLATGVQDTWWVQMPMVAAGASSEISRIVFDHRVDIDSLPVEMGGFVGLGEPGHEDDKPGGRPYVAGTHELVIAPALIEAARKLGAVVTRTTVWHRPVLAEARTWWRTAGRHIDAGHIIGTEERVLVGTEVGLVLDGTLRTYVMDEDDGPADRLIIEGTPTFTLEHTPFPGEQTTNVVLLNRIPDVLSAPGGVTSASALPPASPWLGRKA